MRTFVFAVFILGCGSSDPEPSTTTTDSATTTDSVSTTDTAMGSDTSTTDSVVTDTAASLSVKSIVLKVDGSPVTVSTTTTREYNKNNVKWTIGKPSGTVSTPQYYVVLDIGAVSKKPDDPTFSTADVQFKTLTIFHVSASGETSYSSLGTTGFTDMATVTTADGLLDYTAKGTMKLLSGGSGGPASFAMELTLTGAPLR